MANELDVHDVPATLRELSVLTVLPTTTEEDAISAIRPLGQLNQCLLGTMRFEGETPWEVHPDGDELLYVVAGEVEVTLLTDGGPVQRTLATGCVCVVPRGLWHRQQARKPVSLLFATAAASSRTSWSEDPRAAEE